MSWARPTSEITAKFSRPLVVHATCSITTWVVELHCGWSVLRPIAGDVKDAEERAVDAANASFFGGVRIKINPTSTLFINGQTKRTRLAVELSWFCMMA
jgi:hypothetical protein